MCSHDTPDRLREQAASAGRARPCVAWGTSTRRRACTFFPRHVQLLGGGDARKSEACSRRDSRLGARFRRGLVQAGSPGCRTKQADSPTAPGRNEMDPPLCGSTSMSHNEFKKISEPIEPQEASPMKPAMNVLGIDIAKHVLHAVGMDNTGEIVFRKRLSRHDLIPFMTKLPPCSSA